jgi:hypothetical protein
MIHSAANEAMIIVDTSAPMEVDRNTRVTAIWTSQVAGSRTRTGRSSTVTGAPVWPKRLSSQASTSAVGCARTAILVAAP